MIWHVDESCRISHELSIQITTTSIGWSYQVQRLALVVRRDFTVMPQLVNKVSSIWRGRVSFVKVMHQRERLKLAEYIVDDLAPSTICTIFHKRCNHFIQVLSKNSRWKRYNSCYKNLLEVFVFFIYTIWSRRCSSHWFDQRNRWIL